jgi:hypothetical protein
MRSEEPEISMRREYQDRNKKIRLIGATCTTPR